MSNHKWFKCNAMQLRAERETADWARARRLRRLPSTRCMALSEAVSHAGLEECSQCYAERETLRVVKRAEVLSAFLK